MESDYPIRAEWYKRFEKKAASIIPSTLLPNYLTIFRVAVSGFLIGFGARLPISIVLAVGALGGLSDFFDGAAARARGRKTIFGVVFDPVADKLLMLSMICILVFQRIVSVNLVALIACAEAHILVIPTLSFVYRRSRNGGHMPQAGAEQKVRPSVSGKLKMLLYLLGFLLLVTGRMLDAGGLLMVGSYFVAAGIVAGCFAFVQYMVRYARKPY